MFTGRLIFKQVMDFMPLPTFRRCVAKYKGDFKVKTFSYFDQFLCMAFAHFTHRESLRDIEICLRVQNKKLYHMGIRGRVSRSTLADANEKRDWRIYAECAQSCSQTPYSAGPKGKYTNIYPYFKRQVARRQRSRSFATRSWCILRDGSRLSGFQKALCLQSNPCLFRNPSQSKMDRCGD
jgi:hypothetical protein